MAIGSYTLDYLISLASHLRGRSDLDLLELGEAQLVGFELADRADRIAPVSSGEQPRFAAELAAVRKNDAARIPDLEAKLVYRWLLGMGSYRAVDLGSADPEAWIDLNYPVDLGARYDVVVNNGTSEHIFNQANVFKFIHDHTKLGGLMVHYTTGLGWVEHGFYNLQPSFFFDLAKYNAYEVISCNLINESVSLPLEVGKINGDVLNQDPDLRDALLHCCMRRCDDAPFRYPVQRPYQPSC